LEIESVGTVMVVRFICPHLVGEAVVQGIGRQLNALVEQGEGLRLLLDFRGVQLVSSAVLGKLVGLHRKGRAAGGRLALCGLHPDFHMVLQAVEGGKGSRLLDVFPGAAEALQSLEE
jgi:anti-anti-sigma regulatory factor